MYPVSVPPIETTADCLRAFFMSGTVLQPNAVGEPQSPGIVCPAFPRRGAAAAVPCGLVDVREVAPSLVRLPAPPWSEPELRFRVRPEVATRLARAAEMLPSDVRIGYWEGLRPLYVQQALWETGFAYLRQVHPELTVDMLETVLEQFVARPSHGVPPHSAGSAVDLAPVNAFGQVLAPTDAWGRLANETLGRALSAVGLANYTPEWWHWSYGDDEWARAYDCAPMAFATAPEFDGPGGGI